VLTPVDRPGKGLRNQYQKSQNQLLATESDIPLAQMARGRISSVSTHATGPQEAAKKAL